MRNGIRTGRPDGDELGSVAVDRQAPVVEGPMILAIDTGLSNARSEGYKRIGKHVERIAFGFSIPENQRRRVR